MHPTVPQKRLHQIKFKSKFILVQILLPIHAFLSYKMHFPKTLLCVPCIDWFTAGQASSWMLWSEIQRWETLGFYPRRLIMTCTRGKWIIDLWKCGENISRFHTRCFTWVNNWVSQIGEDHRKYTQVTADRTNIATWDEWAVVNCRALLYRENLPGTCEWRGVVWEKEVVCRERRSPWPGVRRQKAKGNFRRSNLAGFAECSEL